MALLAFILRAILFLFVFRLAAIVIGTFFRAFTRGFRPPAGRTRGGSVSETVPRGQVEELVKDPVCGVHTARSSAIAGRYHGESAYFCSEECAEKARAG